MKRRNPCPYCGVAAPWGSPWCCQALMDVANLKGALIAACADMVKLALEADGISSTLAGRPQAVDRNEARAHAEHLGEALRAACVKRKRALDKVAPWKEPTEADTREHAASQSMQEENQDA